MLSSPSFLQVNNERGILCKTSDDADKSSLNLRGPRFLVLSTSRSTVSSGRLSRTRKTAQLIDMVSSITQDVCNVNGYDSVQRRLNACQRYLIFCDDSVVFHQSLSKRLCLDQYSMQPTSLKHGRDNNSSGAWMVTFSNRLTHRNSLSTIHNINSW